MACVLAAGLCVPAAYAHEGHDHADEAVLRSGDTISPAPRVALQTPRLELVAAREPSALVITIDDYATNAPLDGLDVQVRIGSRVIAAAAAGVGTYRVADSLIDAAEAPEASTAARQAASAGGIPITFLVRRTASPATPEAWSEQLNGILPAADEATGKDARGRSSKSPAVPFIALTIAATLFVLAGLGIAFRRRRHTPRAVA